MVRKASRDTERSMGKPSGISIQNQCPHGLRVPKASMMEIQDSKKGNNTEGPHSEVSSSSQPAQTDCIMQESILRPDGLLPDRNVLLTAAFCVA